MLTPEDQQATMARLLPFQRQMVEELLADDGLCIMSAGMGWQTVRDRHTRPVLHRLLRVPFMRIPPRHELRTSHLHWML